MVADQAVIFARAALPGIELNPAIARQTVWASGVGLLHASSPLHCLSRVPPGGPWRVAGLTPRSPKRRGTARRFFCDSSATARRALPERAIAIPLAAARGQPTRNRR